MIVKPKGVLAIASNGSDWYTAMARVAVASLRLSNPQMTVVLACDRETDRSLQLGNDPILGEVDDRVIVDSPSGDVIFRSRFVKTRVRSVIDGPLVYLDADVVVRGDLSEIFSVQADIAGARNCSSATRDGQLSRTAALAIEEMGWQTSADVYINGGVLYFNDTALARGVGEQWHRHWLKCAVERGDYRDQMALNAALFDVKPRVAVLEDSFNAQFRATPSAAHRARAWHYYGSIVEAPDTQFELLARDLLRGARLKSRRVARLIRAAHPWRRSTVLDDWAAASLMRRNRYDGWEPIWLRREVPRYVLDVLRRRLWRPSSSPEHSTPRDPRA